MTNQANATDISFNKNEDTSIVALIDEGLVSQVSHDPSEIEVKTKDNSKI